MNPARRSRTWLARAVRALVFLGGTAVVCAATLSGSAEAKPPKPAAAPARPAAPKPAAKPAPAKPAAKKPGKEGDAGAAPTTPTREGPVGKETGDAGAAVVESKTGDGGKSFRFEALEVEGRLKSPQIVYFLRRVRAEFSAGDLGHRSFSHELSETRNESSF